jgi:hypothetical protein
LPPTISTGADAQARRLVGHVQRDQQRALQLAQLQREWQLAFQLHGIQHHQ